MVCEQSAPDPSPSTEDVTALLRYVDLLDRPSGELFEWQQRETDDPNVTVFPWVDYKPVVRKFQQELSQRGFVYPFDWGEWEDEALRLHFEPGAMNQATFDDLRKLLTLHVRKDRFWTGHFAAALEEGWIIGILRRLKVIHEQ